MVSAEMKNQANMAADQRTPTTLAVARLRRRKRLSGIRGWRTRASMARKTANSAAAAALFAVFLAIEARVRQPLMPLSLFRLRNLATANVVGVLWSAAMFAWFFISALTMQLVLGYSPMQIGLAFLPSNLIMAAFSLGLSAKMVMRFGIRMPLAAGLVLTAAGLALFALSPVDGSFVLHVLPGMTLLGVGCGMAMNPVLLAAMSEVDTSESGLASGVVNTSFMMGGALGLAVLASLAVARTDKLIAFGADSLAALNGGYHIAFALSAVFAAGAALLSAVLLRVGHQAPAHTGPVGEDFKAGLEILADRSGVRGRLVPYAKKHGAEQGRRRESMPLNSKEAHMRYV